MERPYLQVVSVKITNPLASYTSNCNLNVSKKHLALNRWKSIFWFFFIFAGIFPDHYLYDFGLRFLKVILKKIFMGFYRANRTYYFL